jgi:hypothetical protein
MRGVTQGDLAHRRSHRPFRRFFFGRHSAHERGRGQAQLIKDVLDVSRSMAGKLTFAPRPVGLGPVALAAITTVHPAAAAKGIEVPTNIPPTLPPVSGDEGRLQQILWNLLANAIKFTPRGGQVTLRIRHRGSVLELTVTDTGEGIERPFLPYVCTAAPLMLGKPRAEHSVLPLVSTELPSLAGLTVLVIDDQEYTREIVGAILRRAAANVRTASSRCASVPMHRGPRRSSR